MSIAIDNIGKPKTTKSFDTLYSARFAYHDPDVVDDPSTKASITTAGGVLIKNALDASVFHTTATVSGTTVTRYGIEKDSVDILTLNPCTVNVPVTCDTLTLLDPVVSEDIYSGTTTLTNTTYPAQTYRITRSLEQLTTQTVGSGSVYLVPFQGNTGTSICSTTTYTAVLSCYYPAQSFRMPCTPSSIKGSVWVVCSPATGTDTLTIGVYELTYTSTNWVITLVEDLSVITFLGTGTNGALQSSISLTPGLYTSGSMYVLKMSFSLATSTATFISGKVSLCITS